MWKCAAMLLALAGRNADEGARAAQGNGSGCFSGSPGRGLFARRYEQRGGSLAAHARAVLGGFTAWRWLGCVVYGAMMFGSSSETLTLRLRHGLRHEDQEWSRSR